MWTNRHGGIASSARAIRVRGSAAIPFDWWVHKNDDGDRQGGIPVCCQEDIEAVCGQPKQLAVLLAAPAHRCHVRTSCPDSNWHMVVATTHRPGRPQAGSISLAA